jgi:hypothetical protein
VTVWDDLVVQVILAKGSELRLLDKIRRPAFLLLRLLWILPYDGGPAGGKNRATMGEKSQEILCVASS